MKQYNNIKLSLHEYGIIFYLDKFGESKRIDISNKLKVEGARVGEVLASLRKKGIVATKKNPKDKREVFNYLI